MKSQRVQIPLSVTYVPRFLFLYIRMCHKEARMNISDIYETTMQETQSTRHQSRTGRVPERFTDPLGNRFWLVLGEAMTGCAFQSVMEMVQ